MHALLAELRRRNVFRVAAAYLVVAWLVMQVVVTIADAAGLPGWADSFALILLIAAFPVVLFIAWAFELTPDGLKPTASVDPAESRSAVIGSRLDIAILAGLGLVIILLLANWLVPRSGPAEPAAETAVSADAAPEAAPEASPEPAQREASAPPERSVAVLPFLALSSNEEDRYFADGLTEEILNYLAAAPDLMVTSRTSAFQYRGDDLPPVPEIARQLGVAHIVEGTVRRNGDQVRITAQLIRAGDDTHLWSRTYDRTMVDIFAVQDDIAQSVAAVLNVVLNAEQLARMREQGVQNVDAYIAYQRGHEISHYAHFEAPDLLEALEPAEAFFAEAIELAPGFTNAYLNQADYYAHLMHRASRDTSEAGRRSYAEASERYFELLNMAWMVTPDTDIRAMISVDRVYMSESWAGAADIIDSAAGVAGCPFSAWVRELVSLSGRAADFLPYAEQRTRCDPLNFSNWDTLSGIAFDAGEFDLAFAAASRGLSMAGEHDILAMTAANALLHAGRNEEIRQYMDLMQVDATTRALMEAQMAARAGDRETALAARADMNLPELSGVASIRLSLHAMLGEREEANALAGEIDALPRGDHLLLRVAMNCRCGAPWDLDAAPVFARRIEEAGFPWPPAGAENFPLKDW